MTLLREEDHIEDRSVRLCYVCVRSGVEQPGGVCSSCRTEHFVLPSIEEIATVASMKKEDDHSLRWRAEFGPDSIDPTTWIGLSFKAHGKRRKIVEYDPIHYPEWPVRVTWDDGTEDGYRVEFVRDALIKENAFSNPKTR